MDKNKQTKIQIRLNLTIKTFINTNQNTVKFWNRHLIEMHYLFTDYKQNKQGNFIQF